MSEDDKKYPASDADEGIAALLDTFSDYDSAAAESAPDTTENAPAAEEDTPATAETVPAPAAEETAVPSHAEGKKKKSKKNKKQKNAAPATDTAEAAPAPAAEETAFAEPEAPVTEEAAEESEPAPATDNKKSGKKHRKKADARTDSPAEREAAPDTAKAGDGESTEKKPASPAGLVIVLSAICAAVALLLGAVNYFTAPRIEENAKAAMQESIMEIFDRNITVEDITTTLPADSPLTGLYLVMKNGNVCGYSAATAPSGFGGAISLTVGVDCDGSVVGVKVVSMSETPGLGSKVGNDDFLDRFVGVSGNITAGTDVDVIAGATISSKAVIKGVGQVLSAGVDLAAIAEERGLSLESFVYEEPATTEPVTEAPAVTDGTDVATGTIPPVTEESESVTLPVAPSVDKGDTPPDVIVPTPDGESPELELEYQEGSSEFETLTTEPDSDMTETEEPETEATTEKPVTTKVTTTTTKAPVTTEKPVTTTKATTTETTAEETVPVQETETEAVVTVPAVTDADTESIPETAEPETAGAVETEPVE